MFKLYYGFNTWVLCYPDGEIYRAGAEEEIDNIMIGWNQGI